MLEMDEPVKILDLAKKLIIAITGLRACDIITG